MQRPSRDSDATCTDTPRSLAVSSWSTVRESLLQESVHRRDEPSAEDEEPIVVLLNACVRHHLDITVHIRVGYVRFIYTREHADGRWDQLGDFISSEDDEFIANVIDLSKISNLVVVLNTLRTQF